MCEIADGHAAESPLDRRSHGGGHRQEPRDDNLRRRLRGDRFLFAEAGRVFLVAFQCGRYRKANRPRQGDGQPRHDSKRKRLPVLDFHAAMIAKAITDWQPDTK